VAEPSTKPPVDPRRATAERNAAAILDAAERLLADRTALSMVAIAGEAGVSRPTLYAHYKSIAAIVEAAVERSVVASLAAFEHARPHEGPADRALLRMAEVSLRQLGRYDALARGAAEHLAPGAVHRSHDAMLAPLLALVERGRDEGLFRTDVPAEWLLTMYVALVHGADEHAASRGTDRTHALRLLKMSLTDLFHAGRPSALVCSAASGGDSEARGAHGEVGR
jgi:TetR/AcrR family transcriptional repressor of mexCD-oprJ operon